MANKKSPQNNESLLSKEILLSEENLENLTHREKIIRYFAPWKAIFWMCLPPIIIMIIMSTYNMVDKFLALRFADNYVINNFLLDITNSETMDLQKLARDIINVATQYSTSTISLLTAFSLFISIGTSTRFGVAYGKRDYDLVGKTIANGVLLILILSLFLMPILVFSNKPLILLQAKNNFNVDPEFSKKIFDITTGLAINYTKWFIFFLIFVLISNFMISLLRSEGRGFWATIIILTSVIVNITLDIVLMHYTNMGLEGAAIATVISWIWNIMFVILVIYFDKTSRLKIKFSDLKFNWSITSNIIMIGLTPLFLNFSLSITSLLSNYFVSQLSIEIPPITGTSSVPWVVQVFAGIAPWIALTDAPLIGVSQGARSLLSYTYGAKKYQRIWNILIRILLLQVIILTASEFIIGFFGNGMLRLFISEVPSHYRWYFLLSYIAYPTVAVTFIGLIFFQAINRPKMALFFTSLKSVIVFVPCITIGFYVALYTKNVYYYFLFMGLVSPISALICFPILVMTWKKYRFYLK